MVHNIEYSKLNIADYYIRPNGNSLSDFGQVGLSAHNGSLLLAARKLRVGDVSLSIHGAGLLIVNGHRSIHYNKLDAEDERLNHQNYKIPVYRFLVDLISGRVYVGDRLPT